MNIRFIVILFFYCVIPITQSQTKKDYLKSLDYKAEIYKEKNMLSDIKVDIDGDGIPDYIGIYQEPLMNDSNGIERTNLVMLLSKENYNEFIQPNFLPLQKISKNGFNEYSITSLNKTKDGIKVIISKRNEKLSVYRRTIIFNYDKKNNTLIAIRDGGVGVFDKSEKYLDVEKFTGEKITLKNWDEWYSSLMCSSPLTLNNRLVFVNNESEFINAIENNTTIIIKAKKLDLSLAKTSDVDIVNKTCSPIRFGAISKDMGVAYDDLAWWVEDVTNMSIIGSSTQLISTSSDEYILWFNKCKNIEISNISVFHDPSIRVKENGWNMCISNSSDITITHTNFKKFGSTGLFISNSQDINIFQSSFDGLKNYAVLTRTSSNLNFVNCCFFRNQSNVIHLDNTIAFFNSCNFYDNTYNYLVFLNDVDLNKSFVSFINCKEYNNSKLYDNSNKLGYSFFYGLSDLDQSENINSGNVTINF